ncbi:hypothetical protein LGT39_02525 [Demequina sp. TTPB684]|uniref:FtsX-like permease family protein n=1 Tax=unclassified Demequina TaxID=2620311 RepID=UPI001CF13C50|nr:MULTISPECIES: FtsX-like permease family protein [unclassified Demequina]MCB2411723.1 hypothetical protein [Demequina sp. TTPB684]UPU87632.1 hypothetical protein LGT36_010260 [Demequina sp. TMPB413]
MSTRSKADSTPRLGALQWVGPGLVGLLALAVALAQEPLFTRPTSSGSGSITPILPAYYDFLIMLFYSPVLIGLLASLIGAFRAISTASHRREFRALMDLGAPRKALVREQVRLGLFHGAVAALTGTVLGTGITQGVAGPGGHFNSNTAWTLLTVLLLLVVATTLAYWFVGFWVTGGTGRAVSPRDIEVAMGVESVPIPRRRLRRFAVPLALAAFVVVSALVTPHLETSNLESSGLVKVWIIAYSMVAFFGIPFLIIWAGAKAAAWLSHLTGRALLHGGNAARIAGDGLTRPTPARAVAIGAVGLVLGGTLAIGIMVNALEARNDAGAALTPSLMVSTTGLPDRDIVAQASQAVGWNSQGLDPELVAALQADDRVIAVPAAMLTARVGSTDGSPAVGDDSTTYLAVDPTDLDRVSKGSARALYFEGAVAMGGGVSPAVLSVGEASAKVTSPKVGGPFTALPRDWAEGEFGRGVTSAVLLYDGEAGDAQAAIVDYDVDDLRVTDFGGGGTGSGGLNRAGVLTVSGTLLLLAVGMVIALSLSVQRTRGHDYATMSALGASRPALRWGTAIESAVVAASGSVMGILLGGAWGLWLGLSSDRISWELVWTGIAFDLDHAPWGTVLTLALAAIVASAIASVIARSRLERLTPAEQLREAIKEGAL